MSDSEWYRRIMSGTYVVTMGDRGRLVVPVEIRERGGLAAGDPLVIIESDAGLVLLTREQAKARVREELNDTDLVEALLADRRRQAAAEAT